MIWAITIRTIRNSKNKEIPEFNFESGSYYRVARYKRCKKIIILLLYYKYSNFD